MLLTREDLQGTSAATPFTGGMLSESWVAQKTRQTAESLWINADKAGVSLPKAVPKLCAYISGKPTIQELMAITAFPSTYRVTPVRGTGERFNPSSKQKPFQCLSQPGLKAVGGP